MGVLNREDRGPDYAEGFRDGIIEGMAILALFQAVVAVALRVAGVI